MDSRLKLLEKLKIFFVSIQVHSPKFFCLMRIKMVIYIQLPGVSKTYLTV